MASRAFRDLAAIAIAGVMPLVACGNGDDDVADAPLPSLASTCRAPSASQAFHLVNAFPGVKVDRPTSIVSAGGDVYYVTEQGGTVRRIWREGVQFKSNVFLDISAGLLSTGEMGLLGIALSPDFAWTGELFLTYTRRATLSRESIGQTVLARFVTRDGGRTAHAAPDEILLTLERHQQNHNGGRVVFGPDRYLYVGIGDDAWGDPKHRAQNPDELFGKVLRLDVLGAHPYGIPPDNPYASGGGRPEVYARGFRNPWSFSFDRTGRLWLADVGHDRYEELDVVTKGGNYGWPIRDGAHCLYDDAPCDLPGASDPFFEYPHVDGFSITGGFVYRGKKLALYDQYVFSDFMTGRVWSLDPNAPATSRLLFDSGLFISNFAEDPDGELLLLDYGGRVMRMEASAAAADPEPVTLRGLGCLEGTTQAMARGMFGYDVIAPLWSDGLDKRRWVTLPASSKISVNPDETWELPAGAMLLKEFSWSGRRIETRMLVRDAAAGWLGYTFAWNDAQTDAALLSEAKDVELAEGQNWTIPSRAQCFTCHSGARESPLGFNGRQMNHAVRTSAGGHVNQIAALEGMNAFDRSVADDVAPSFPDPLGSEGTIEARARAYLSTNCASCHRAESGSSGGLDLRASTSVEKMGVVCRLPRIGGDLGITNALIVAPREPERSVLYERMASTGAGRMPRIGSHRVDTAGLDVIRSWIMSLEPCP